MDHSKEENQIMRLNVEIRIWSILSHLDGNRVHLFPFFDMTSKFEHKKKRKYNIL